MVWGTGRAVSRVICRLPAFEKEATVVDLQMPLERFSSYRGGAICT